MVNLPKDDFKRIIRSAAWMLFMDKSDKDLSAAELFGDLCSIQVFFQDFFNSNPSFHLTRYAVVSLGCGPPSYGPGWTIGSPGEALLEYMIIA